MDRSAPVDGFSLAFMRHGVGEPVVLLHGWPGDHGDWRELVPRLSDAADVVVPDLRGFGESDKHERNPREAYAAGGQAISVVGLIRELGLAPVVLGGYDIGSRVAQEIARSQPELVRALVIAPPVPGAGERVLSPVSVPEFWYQHFHQLELAERLVDGRPEVVRAYLEYFWSHWSGPSYTPESDELDRLTAHYGQPGAFVASIAWYRAGAGTIARIGERAPEPSERISVPTTVLWPEHDPLFPPEWSDRLDEFFADVECHELPAAGHFAPLEAAGRFAEAIRAVL